MFYSGDLTSEKHNFVLRPIQMRLIEYQNGTKSRSELFETYYNNGLPTVQNPGTDFGDPFIRNRVRYEFVIVYQIWHNP